MNQRRPRGRNNNNRGRHQNPRNQTFDSNGPEGRVRGSAAQVLERYLAQARDAQAAGDAVLAENLFQHAEHYYRILSAATAQNEQMQRERQASFEDRRNQRPDSSDNQWNDDSDGSDDNEPSGQAETRPQREEPARAAAEEPAEPAPAAETPPPRPRRRRSAAPQAESAEGESAGEAKNAAADGDGASIDAAFLKAAPKPRRRRAVSETEAAD